MGVGLNGRRGAGGPRVDPPDAMFSCDWQWKESFSAYASAESALLIGCIRSRGGNKINLMPSLVSADRTTAYCDIIAKESGKERGAQSETLPPR
ncbi:hypothetical protein GWI33_015274 [Rhynchophorus ferrugineus]|uniref:Uncharacterized protein n=1 Tax=Rhynchophorus ferrugineus TaxID=354439 RepID=A0A834I3X0_RHYFE|nr:hypothetical protein GWI33_015274 [Rhynchophorus ferrugineus]